MTLRPLLPLVLLLSPACSDRDAPRPVPVPDPTTGAGALPSVGGAPAAPATDPDDPREPGISDLARLARYVYKTMQAHEEVCPFENPYRDRLHFALEIEVKAGRMTRVGLGQVGIEPEGAGEARALARKGWPRELTSYAACLEPHLEAVAMDPSPADGSYEPLYSFSGSPAGRATP